MLNFSGEALVRKAGLDANGEVTIELQPLKAGTQFNWVWHQAPASLQREYLAVAISAITTNKRVFCTLPDTESTITPIKDFGLVKE